MRHRSFHIYAQRELDALATCRARQEFQALVTAQLGEAAAWADEQPGRMAVVRVPPGVEDAEGLFQMLVERAGEFKSSVVACRSTELTASTHVLFADRYPDSEAEGPLPGDGGNDADTRRERNAWRRAGHNPDGAKSGSDATRGERSDSFVRFWTTTRWSHATKPPGLAFMMVPPEFAWRHELPNATIVKLAACGASARDAAIIDLRRPLARRLVERVRREVERLTARVSSTDGVVYLQYAELIDIKPDRESADPERDRQMLLEFLAAWARNVKESSCEEGAALDLDVQADTTAVDPTDLSPSVRRGDEHPDRLRARDWYPAFTDPLLIVAFAQLLGVKMDAIEAWYAKEAGADGHGGLPWDLSVLAKARAFLRIGPRLGDVPQYSLLLYVPMGATLTACHKFPPPTDRSVVVLDPGGDHLSGAYKVAFSDWEVRFFVEPQPGVMAPVHYVWVQNDQKYARKRFQQHVGDVVEVNAKYALRDTLDMLREVLRFAGRRNQLRLAVALPAPVDQILNVSAEFAALGADADDGMAPRLEGVLGRAPSSQDLQCARGLVEFLRARFTRGDINDLVALEPRNPRTLEALSSYDVLAIAGHGSDLSGNRATAITLGVNADDYIQAVRRADVDRAVARHRHSATASPRAVLVFANANPVGAFESPAEEEADRVDEQDAAASGAVSPRRSPSGRRPSADTEAVRDVCLTLALRGMPIGGALLHSLASEAGPWNACGLHPDDRVLFDKCGAGVEKAVGRAVEYAAKQVVGMAPCRVRHRGVSYSAFARSPFAAGRLAGLVGGRFPVALPDAIEPALGCPAVLVSLTRWRGHAPVLIAFAEPDCPPLDYDPGAFFPAAPRPDDELAPWAEHRPLFTASQPGSLLPSSLASVTQHDLIDFLIDQVRSRKAVVPDLRGTYRHVPLAIDDLAAALGFDLGPGPLIAVAGLWASPRERVASLLWVERIQRLLTGLNAEERLNAG